MSRLEVTLGEWLEFIEDTRAGGRLDENGRVEPECPSVRGEMAVMGLRPKVAILPNRPLIEKETGTDRWRLRKDLDGAFPAMGVSHFAAQEYAHWKTVRQPSDRKKFRFRLPMDLEWERAARGVDRRTYPWGNYRIWSFCWSLRGALEPAPNVVGISPFDESVFGVRDMAGSVLEHVDAPTVLRMKCYRGGSWDQPDDEYFRCASRNGINPEMDLRDSGFRLAADLEPIDGAGR